MELVQWFPEIEHHAPSVPIILLVRSGGLGHVRLAQSKEDGVGILGSYRGRILELVQRLPEIEHHAPSVPINLVGTK